MGVALRLTLFACLGLAASGVSHGDTSTAASSAPVQGPAGTIVRAALTQDELAGRQEAFFGLKLRNAAELEARIAAGEILTPAQMIARYFPTAESWRRVAAWATANGYSVTDEAADPSHMTVFAHSTVARVQDTLHMRFARVIGTDSAECTSAVTPPVIPSELADAVDHVARLYPHMKPRHSQVSQPPTIIPVIGTTLLNPKAITQLYNASGLTIGSTPLDGTGQTIVILGGSVVNTADLTAFWTRAGLPTTLAQFTEIDPFPVSSLSPNADAFEETSDLEVASAMAPGARLLYISTVDPSTVLAVLMNQAASIPGIHQINASYGLPEACYQANGAPPQDTPYYSAMAAMGITIFTSSGDNGSNANTTANLQNGNGYDPNGVLAPDYPASDPYVTAVGGTAVGYPQDSSNQYHLPATEGGWCLPNPPISPVPGKPPNYSLNASSGGVSLFFPQPSWQKGSVTGSTSMRCVPDVAAISISNPLEYTYFGGTYSAFAGTSLSSPVWAGLCALLNQARSLAGFSPLGLLGPHVFPLAGTAAFHTFTTGSNNGDISLLSNGSYSNNTFVSNSSNGAYTVGGSYNLATGLGSPNIANLVADLATTPGTSPGPTAVPPVITTQPASLSVLSGGNATFTVTATGIPAPTYQWYFAGQTISGATNASYAIGSVQPSNGGAYVVVASNSAGNATSNAAVLAVNQPPRIMTSPVSETVSAGSGATLSVSASGGTSYQWQFNGTAISGASSATLLLSNAGTIQEGAYAVVVTNGFGSVTSNTATVAVNVASHLYNISSRGYLGPGPNQNLVTGFFTDGSGSKNILVRGIGPNLAIVDPPLSGLTLASPKLTLYNAKPSVLATNAAWGGGQVLTNAFATVYATPLQAGSSDAAVFTSVPASAGTGYTAEVDGLNGGTGIAMIELYDYDSYTGTPASRLINISSRALVGTGSKSLVAGFWVVGSTSQTLLIRALGPGLAANAPALSGQTLARPALTLFDSTGNIIATNIGWGSAPTPGGSTVAAAIQPATTAIMGKVYASTVAAGSADCAMVVTLPAGSSGASGYTAQVSSADSTTGIALIEVYNVP